MTTSSRLARARRVPAACARTIALTAATLGAILAPDTLARQFRPGMIPNGDVFSCNTCHLFGGGTARNPFGLAVQAITGSSSRAFWTPTLAAVDSDGDGFTNGQELGDPDGDGIPTPGATITNPGDPNSKPVNQAPQISLSGPTDGAVFSAPALAAVTASASDGDGTIARVEFFTNGRLLGAVTTPPYSLLVDWALGAHTVTARATDNQGASATSPAIAMTVNAPDPTTLAAPKASGADVELQWNGGAGPFAVQTRATLNDPWCTSGDMTTNRSATIANKGGSALFQVADLAAAPAIPFSVVLAGAHERPNPVTTTASGFGTLKLLGSTLTFDIQYSGFGEVATLAHIHGPSSIDGTAGVMIDLAPFNGGAFGTNGTLAGSVILTPAQKAAILSGKTYVNVHTATNKGGEIRGQVVPVLMQASLAGANERPNPVASSGFGSALFLLAGDQLTFQVTYGGLGGPATLAHIHGPADADNAAGVMIDLAPFNGGAFGTSGSLAGTVTLTPAQLSAVASGRTYVNVHTDANRAGEIRGQIVPCATAVPFSASLAGAFEKPNAVTTAGTGTGLFALEGQTLLFNVGYTGLSGTATLAHIHGPADVNTAAGVMIDLKPFNGGAFGTHGTLSGSVVLTADQRAALLAGRTYVNVHTEANKPGEIRGQIAPVLSIATLNGANEKPTAVTTTGAGTGHFLLAGNQLRFNVTYRALSGAATLAHIHGPADENTAAPVMVDLAPFNGGAFGASGALGGTLTLDAASLPAFIAEQTYVNVHTAANKPGEIRGQVIRPVLP